jgi:hypothetical protein
MENTAKISISPAAVPPPAPHDWVFEVAESARKAESSLQNFISENPVRSVAIAVGLGFATQLIFKNLATNRVPRSQEQL